MTTILMPFKLDKNDAGANMDVLPLKIHQEHTATSSLAINIISAVQAEHFDIVGSTSAKARRASSCLTVPQVGDSVLTFNAQNEIWIIAVLSMAGQNKVALDGPEIAMQSDRLTISAREIHSDSEYWLASHKSLRVFTSNLIANVVGMEWIGKTISVWTDLISCNSRRTMRNVSEIETIQCGNYDLQVKEAMALNSENAVITSDKLMKIDGEQIHVG